MIKLSSRLKSFFLFIIVFLGISSFLLFGNRLFANSEADSESSLAFLPIVMNNADGSHKPTPNSTSTSTATTTATATITSTPTTNATATFTPLATTTATTTNTPGRPYITLQPNCANGPDPQFVVFGLNWPPDEDIGLFWDNDILMIIDANQHNGAFSRVITIHSVTDGTYTVKAISENLIEDTAVFTVPCDLPPTPTNPATSTPTHTSTPSFESCPVRFEGNAVAGNDFVSVTGDVGTTVTIINVDTGVPLGSTTLIARDGHFCAGFADFQEPLHNPLIEQLQQGHLLVASSDDGSNDETFVIGQTATATPTNTHTPTPSSTPTHTPQVTLTLHYSQIVVLVQMFNSLYLGLIGRQMRISF
ncbi:MAG: hypothetical protein GY943_34975 [Chloroflexi bacterium]|nr:hypothetical protein [Chloroflexota bacterium]